MSEEAVVQWAYLLLFGFAGAVLSGHARKALVLAAVIFVAILWASSIQDGGLWDNLGGVFLFLCLIGGPVIVGALLLVHASDRPTGVDWDKYDTTEAETVEKEPATNETPGKVSLGTSDTPSPSETRDTSSDLSEV